MNKQRVVFDSRVSKKLNEDATVEIPISQDELNWLVRAYQDYKQKQLTKMPTLEKFIKERIFEGFKEYRDADI